MMNEVKKVNTGTLNSIIETRQPSGLFYAQDNGTYIAVDNSTGDAWTEEFSNHDDCTQWLMN